MTFIYKDDDCYCEYNHGYIKIDGSLRYPYLKNYKKFKEFLMKALLDCVEKQITVLDINVEDLIYLNSSGFATLSTLILESKRSDIVNSIRLFGNSQIDWQMKILKNCKKMWENVSLFFDKTIMEEETKVYKLESLKRLTQ